MSITALMLVALGFLVAALLVILLTPSYRRRTTRLAEERLKRQLPLTLAEITADKDRLRAEFAVQLHKLETRVEEATLNAARQMVELNRRDAQISALEGEVAQLGTALEEHENARRVLEQTIMDRLPKVEHRLAEAKKLLFQRDREISQLTQSADKQGRALEEATLINTQQRDEIHRLNAALTTRAARNRESLGDSAFDGEVALRSEIEALRDKTRDQGTLIERLQATLLRAGIAAEGIAGRDAASLSESTGDYRSSEHEIIRLRSSLAEAEAALRAAQSAASASAPVPVNETELRALKSANQDQAAEIARLAAALKSYEDGIAEADAKGAARDSRIAMKARVASLEAHTTEQATTIQSLRAEIAAANERLARQATHFRDEMRRLGAGTIPVSADARRSVPEPPAPVKRSLSDRINDPRDNRAVRELSAAAEPASAPAAAPPREGARVSAFLKAIEGNAGEARAAVKSVPVEATSSPTDGAAAEGKKPRLLERISGLDKQQGS